MDDKQLAEYIDQNRWLMNNGLFPEHMKNQLFMFGTIVNLQILAVEVSIHPKLKQVSYKLYGDDVLLAKQDKFIRLSTLKTYFGLWRFKRFLKKHGSFDFNGMLNRCVKDLCGPAWFATVEVFNISKYNPTEDISEPELDGQEFGKQPDR